MIAGITAKRQPTLDRWYEQYDDQFKDAEELSKRFRRTFEQIEETFGEGIVDSVYSSEVMFFSLAVLVYDALYELGSPLSPRRAKQLSPSFAERVWAAGAALDIEDVDPAVLDAVRRAPVDAARRSVRHEFLRSSIGVATNE